MPPQAFMKSPDSISFMSGGQGEWSEATPSICPALTASHSLSWLALARSGGAHLYQVAPSGTLSAEKVR